MAKPLHSSRRSFIKRAGLTAASLSFPWKALGQNSAPSGPPTTESPSPAFEVDGSVYAWEMHDEGMDVILDNMTELAGINAVYLVALMHPEHRPFTSKTFPHNPMRTEWTAEDSCVYFHPQTALYSRIKPAVSKYEWLNSTDWLKALVDSAHVRGLKAGAEISHTPIAHSVLKENPELQQRDIDNKPKGRMCPNNPDVREYLVALFGDVADNYKIDFIQTCMWLFTGGGPGNGTCFCQSCQNEAAASGFDLAAAIPILKADPQAQPQLEQWLTFRRNSVAKIYRLIADRVHKTKPDLDFRINDTLPFGPGLKADAEVGLHLDDLKGAINSCVIQDHTEQLGKANETFSFRKSWIASDRALLAAGVPLLSGVAVRPKATPDLIHKGIVATVASGTNGIACKHYDGATFSQLRAVRDGLTAAGIKGFSAVNGIEAVSMTLAGYVPDIYLDESCVKAAGTGTAVAKFTQPSGTHTIVVSYASENAGQGSLTVLVGGIQKAIWPLVVTGEATGCWKRKNLANIYIQTGDEIKIVGVAGNVEGARLSFIEFKAM